MTIVKFKDISAGFAPDTMPEELAEGAFSGCVNMRFRGGFAERFRGMANIFGTPGAPPYWIAPYASMASRYWVYAGLAKLFCHDGVTQSDITPTSPPTGGIDDRFTGGAFNGVMVFNNSVDVPWVWGGNPGVPAIPMPAWDSSWRAFSLRPFGNFLVAVGLVKGSQIYPHMVKWSNPAEPGAVPTSWDEANPANDAGERDLAATADVMVDCLPMGDQLIIYKERSMYSMRYIGGEQIFATQRIPGETGMLARGCAVDTPIGHVVLTAGDVVVHQGQQAVSIADGVIRKWIFNNMNSLVANRSFVVTNPQKSEVLICFPSANSETCDVAAVYNWISKAWGTRALNGCTYGATGQINPDATLLQWDQDDDTWDSDATTWNENEYAANEARLLFSRVVDADPDPVPNISAFDVGTTDFGAEIGSMLERTAALIGDPGLNKYLRAVYPRIDASQGAVVNITVGAAMNASEAPTWGAPVPFIVGGPENKADVNAAGRFLSYRIEGTGFDSWRTRSVDFDAVPLGAY